MANLTELEHEVSALKAHVSRLEDERAIARLLSAYGPLVDSGSGSEAAALWCEDGVYDIDEVTMSNRTEIEAMVHGSNHQGLIADGCAHVLSPPHVSVDGDSAIAVCHSMLVVNSEAGFAVRRATANYFELERGAHGWQITRRTARLLDGRRESPALLARGFNRSPATVRESGSPSIGPDSRHHVLQILAHLQRAIDTRDWATIRECFTENATAYGVTGIEEIIGIMLAHLGGVGPTQHLIGNQRVEFDGAGIRTRTYTRVHHMGAGVKEGSFFECMGEYDDRWVKTDLGWRIASRTFAMEIAIGDREVLRPA